MDNITYIIFKEWSVGKGISTCSIAPRVHCNQIVEPGYYIVEPSIYIVEPEISLVEPVISLVEPVFCYTDGSTILQLN